MVKLDHNNTQDLGNISKDDLVNVNEEQAQPLRRYLRLAAEKEAAEKLLQKKLLQTMLQIRRQSQTGLP